jgi:hypothetical protein
MRIVALCVAAAAWLSAQESPAPATEQRVTGVLELGYRWRTEPGGSVNSYRSVVDLGSGPKMLNTDFTIVDPKGRLFDRIDTRASNWGDDPYSTLHVSARKLRWYDFSADHRNIAYFNYLPSFANPLLSRGILLNERSFDIRRRTTAVQLDILPGNWFVPYVAYERSSGSGRGINTFVSDLNEYPVPTIISDGLNLYRGGVRLQLPRLNMTVEQGGTTFKDDQSLFENTPNPGNRETPFLGRTLMLNSLMEAYGIRSTSVYGKLSGTGSVTRWLNLSGDLMYSRPKTDVSFQQASSGNFVVSSEVLAFTAQQFVLSAQASMPRTTGTFGAELLAHRRVRVMWSFLTDRFDNNGSSAARNTLMDVSALPVRALDLTSFLRNEYSHLATDVIFDVNTTLTLRAGHRYVWGKGTSRVLPEQGLVSADDGRLRRNVWNGGFSYRPTSKLVFNGDAEGAASARIYFRTGLNDYQRGALRARYRVTQNLHLTGDFRILNNQNPTPGVNYEMRGRRVSMALQWLPEGGKRISVQAEYARSGLESEATYLIPQTLQPDRSHYREYAHTAGALIDLVLPGAANVIPKLSFGGSLYRSGGTRPTSYYQPTGSLTVPFRKNVAWVSSWRYYGFGEAVYFFERFQTHLIQTGVRFSR